MIFRNGARKRLASQVMMLVRPAGGVGNLIGVRRARQRLGQERIGLKRDPLNQLLQLARGERWRGLCKCRRACHPR